MPHLVFDPGGEGLALDVDVEDEEGGDGEEEVLDLGLLREDGEPALCEM